jgi:ribosomal protein L24
MKDSKGNKISIGDRVKILRGFDNKIHTGNVVNINENVVTISAFWGKISTTDYTKIIKIPNTK